MTATDWTDSTIPADIAIVGMACRVPGANNTDEYWANLREGVESVTRYTDAQLLERGVSQEVLDNPRYVKAAAELQGVEGFDAAFFGLSAREAELMDPQHRLFLECAYAALDDAAYDPKHYEGLIGVYGGSTMNTYLLFNLMSNRGLLQVVGDQQTMLGNDKEYLASRVSYKLGLTGPSLAVQSGCSTSLAAVHVASQAILSGECDMALAGGASLRMPHNAGYMYQPGGTSSPDGHCRAFDARAAGSVVGSGVGVVMLKHLSDAQRDGDHIYAVIKGTALNNDGSAKMSFTAPSVDGQARAVASALANAGLSGSDIDYVECHGTGTKLGDPIEVAALTKGFRESTDARQATALGSVKTNIGHSDAAAGISGLIKAVLCIQHRMIPPTLHFESPNPEIDFDNSPFYVNASLRDWDKPDGVPRRAGVNSLGLGGTNAHVVLEEPPVRAPTTPSPRHQLLTLSAATAASLDMVTEQMGDWLRAHPQADLGDVAHTLRSRKPHSLRRTVVARDAEDATFALGASGSSRVHSDAHTSEPGGIALLFPGQGSQRPGMGAALYRTEPAFAEAADECLEAFGDSLAADLRRLVFEASGMPSASAGDELRDTALAQPALFMTGYALARLLTSYGLRYDATAGHSIGELVSACVAGVFSLADAARVVEARGRLVASCPAGAMLSVPLSEADVQELLPPGLSIAAVNGPALVAVSGAEDHISSLAEVLEGRGIATRRLEVSHGFHSALLDPIVEQYREVVASVDLHAPTTAFVSNVTGTWITAEDAVDPDYWVRHLREPVRFWECLRTLADGGSGLFVECGPGRALSTLSRQLDGDGRWALPVLAERPGDDDRLALLEAIGKLWRHGIELDWTSGSGPRRRLSLPSYAFERRRYWVDPPAATAVASPVARHASGSAEPSWLYDWSWRRLARTGQVPVAGRPVVLAGSAASSFPLAEELEQHGCTVGALVGSDDLGVPPGRRAARDDTDACARLFADLSADTQHAPTMLLVAGASDHADDPIAEACRAVEELGEMVGLLAGLGRRARLVVVTRGAYDVTGVEPIDPAAAAVAAAARVVPQEQPQIETTVLDLPAGATELPPAALLRSLGETRLSPYPRAWRGAHLWAVDLVPSDEDPWEHASSTEPGTYLVVGAGGAVGSALVDALADSGATTVVGVDLDATSVRQRADGSVHAYQADATDAEALSAVLERARDRHGDFRGAFFCAGPRDAVVTPLTAARRDMLASHIEVRGGGVRALAACLPSTGAQWCVAVSSLATLLGGVGNGAYAASHAVMDAVVAGAASEEGGPRWLAVDLDHWGMDGGEVDFRGERALTDAEGTTVLRYLAESGRTGAVLLSLTDLLGRMRSAAATEQENRAKDRGLEAAETGATGHPRPDIATPYMAPRDELEEEVVRACAEMLGFERVGVHDSFFELGGDSLMAMQFITHLRDRYGVDIPVPTLFESVTMSNIAAHIKEANGDAGDGRAPSPATSERAAPEPIRQRLPLDTPGDGIGDGSESLADLDPDELERVLAEVESLSDEEVQQHLEGSS